MTPKTDKAPSKEKSPKSPSHAHVIDAIRQGILANELAPGQRLVEAELCDQLGASRGTVRAALIDLVHEGFVERIANRGARVRIVSLQEALEIAEVRLAVESLCVARAAERISEKEIGKMRALAKQLGEQAELGDVRGFADVTHAIFDAYVRIAEQPVAAEMLAKLRAMNSRHRFRLTYRSGRSKIALPYWLALVDAICRRDPLGAQTALRQHAENVQDAMRALAHERAGFTGLFSAADG
jgi:DNA-binding GntR family transcriptional regulator